MTALTEVVAACDETLRSHAVAAPAAGRFDPAVHGPTRAFVLEAVYEGYLLHYSEPRAFEGMDADLRLLAGDALYALGLARLAEEGDLEAVAELADLISLCARVHADGRDHLAEGLWTAGAQALTPSGGAGSRAALDGDLASGD